jgi:hypothetical protein
MTSRSGEGILANLLDRLISYSEGNPLVHAAIVGEGWIIDPVWRVERSPLSKYARNGWAFHVRATDAERAKAVRWAEAHLGNTYGIGEILADAARFDLHLVLPSWYRWRPQHWTCSGFVTQAYLAAGVELTKAPVPAPVDLGYSPQLIGRRPWDAPEGGQSITPRQRTLSR